MSTPISKIANVIIPVIDQDQALQVYTEALGLEKRADPRSSATATAGSRSHHRALRQ
jgi:catechol-2,3-dioxygenase